MHTSGRRLQCEGANEYNPTVRFEPYTYFTSHFSCPAIDIVYSYPFWRL